MKPSSITPEIRADFERYLKGEIQRKEIAVKHGITTSDMSYIAEALIKERLNTK